MTGLAARPGPSRVAAGEVLCIDDDPVVQIMLEEVVRLSGAHYHAAGTAREAEDKLASSKFDLILLDRRLPDGDGLVLMDQVRRGSACPVIVLSELGCDRDRQLGFGLGAAEYIGKPFNPSELVGRVRFILEQEQRRRETDALRPIELDGLRFTPGTRRLVIGGQTSFLPPAEARLLGAFLARIGDVLSRDELTDAVSGREWSPGDRTADVLVARLRKRIPLDVAEIVTVHRLGYCFALALPTDPPVSHPSG